MREMIYKPLGAILYVALPRLKCKIIIKSEGSESKIKIYVRILTNKLFNKDGNKLFFKKSNVLLIY